MAQSPDGFPRLLGDIGGTHARWGWQWSPGTAPTLAEVHPTSAHSSPAVSAGVYLAAHGLPHPAAIGLGIATAIQGDEIRMTNLPWVFSLRALGEALGAKRCMAINDFTALALAVPDLGQDELRALGGGSAVEGAPKGVIGPGTGLGVSGLLADPRGMWLALSGEGGHVTLAATCREETEVVGLLQARFGHVSAERVLSGNGLVNLHAALCERDGVAPEDLPASEVTQRAIEGVDARCAEALGLFTAFLGDVAGNLALTLGARGGVYIGGGIVPRLGVHFDSGLFRRRFEAKGRFAAYLRGIPAWLVTAESPALRGVAVALDHSLHQG